MKNLKYILLAAVAIAAFYYGSNIGLDLLNLEKENTRLHKKLIGQEEKYEQLNLYTAALNGKYLKQLELKKAAEERFSEVIKKKNERIKLLSDATYLIGRHVEKQNGPDYYFETKKRTKNYVLNELRLEGSDSPAIGYILIKNDGRTYKRNYKFEISVETLQTIDEETGRIRVFSKAYLIPREPSPLAKRVEGYKKWNGIKYPLQIRGGTALIDPTIKNQLSPKFHLWAPDLNANINLSGGDPAAGLGVSLMGYGRSENDLSFKFIQLGAHYNDELGAQGTITPVLWRPIPKLLSNTYVGPGISLKNDGVGYFLGIQVGL